MPGRGSAPRSRQRCRLHVSLDDEGELRPSTASERPVRGGAGECLHLSTQRGILDRQFLDAGEEHLIDAALPFEVVAAVPDSQRRTGIRMRRFTKTISAAGPVAR